MNPPVETYILEMLDSASAEELWLAAEAIVDAALYRRALIGLPVLSTEDRTELIQEIFEEPSRAASLFFGTGALH